MGALSHAVYLLCVLLALVAGGLAWEVARPRFIPAPLGPPLKIVTVDNSPNPMGNLSRVECARLCLARSRSMQVPEAK